MMHKQRVVVIGGGTGIYPVVTALRQLPVECASIINTSDSGGSTGRIRDEFGFPPVGDLRQSLSAMADPMSQNWIRQLLLYRFDKGTGLKGHNLGNLILTALQDLTGSTTEALSIAATVFRIHGRVIPVTEDDVHLEIEYEDGTLVNGEHQLDDVQHTPHQKVRAVRVGPHALLSPTAQKAIIEAEYIIIGPGDYYASLQSVLVVPGIKHAFSKTKAKCIYFVNLMTRSTQTIDMSASEHVAGIERSIGRKLDTVIINTKPIPDDIKATYAKEDEAPVEDDLETDKRVLRAVLLATTTAKQSAADVVARSLLRHDEQRVHSVLKKVLAHR